MIVVDGVTVTPGRTGNDSMRPSGERRDDLDVHRHQGARCADLAHHLTLLRDAEPECASLNRRRRRFESADPHRNGHDAEKADGPEHVLLGFLGRLALDIQGDVPERSSENVGTLTSLCQGKERADYD
jgi:hypothetical protein